MFVTAASKVTENVLYAAITMLIGKGSLASQ